VSDIVERLWGVGKRVSVPCPDKLEGCLVLHSKIETDPACIDAINEINRLRAALKKAHRTLKDVPSALTNAFMAGIEECERGSVRRQALYMKSVEDLRTEIRAALPKGESDE
jgi:hypothetical protein